MQEVVTDKVYTPGERVAFKDSSCQEGTGTYLKGDYLCASVVGKLVEHTGSDSGQDLVVFGIVRPRSKRSVCFPKIGDLVVCKVVKVSLKQVFVDIIQIQDQEVVETFSGLIRSSDIRAFDIDAVEVHRCFRPRDIIRARVLSLGDQRAYFLTTAEKDLGVVSCKSNITGSIMVPFDEKTMICEETQEKEERKSCFIMN